MTAGGDDKGQGWGEGLGRGVGARGWGERLGRGIWDEGSVERSTSASTVRFGKHVARRSPFATLLTASHPFLLRLPPS